MPPIDDLARTLSQANDRRTFLGTLIAAAALPAEEGEAKKKRKKRRKKKSGSRGAPANPTTTTTTTTPAPDIYACPPRSCTDGPIDCGPPGSLCRCVGGEFAPGAIPVKAMGVR